MATVLETKIQLRRGTESQWAAIAATFVPLEGEPCVTTDGEHKGQLKIGDGTSKWGELKYIGATVDNNVFLVANDTEEDDLTKIQEVVGATPLQKGDMAIVKKLITGDKYEYKAYIYVTQWEAMDGNYSAENVFFKTDMVITANIGVQTIGGTGSKTLPTTGKNVKQVFDAPITCIITPTYDPFIEQPVFQRLKPEQVRDLILDQYMSLVHDTTIFFRDIQLGREINRNITLEEAINIPSYSCRQNENTTREFTNTIRKLVLKK